MKPQLLTGLACLALCLLSSGLWSQTHGFRFNANYLLTQEPVFMLGYEFAADSSSWSWNANVDGGRFVHRSADLPSAQTDTYVVRGLGLELSSRRYFSQHYTGPYGFFLSAFAHAHNYVEEKNSGIGAKGDQLVVDNPTFERHNYQTMRYGAGLGYRSGCEANRLHVEGLAGWYFGDNGLSRGAGAFYDNLSQSELLQRKFKVELNLVFIF
ncbi:MAG: hypothetical protein KDC12_01585 [Flavobacteriales bacterium]|nr:hypothetical protein [Flavobacteriales bacterium]